MQQTNCCVINQIHTVNTFSGSLLQRKSRQIVAVVVVVVVVVVVNSVFIRWCPFSRGGRIHPIPSAIARTPSLHLS